MPRYPKDTVYTCVVLLIQIGIPITTLSQKIEVSQTIGKILRRGSFVKGALGRQSRCRLRYCEVSWEKPLAPSSHCYVTCKTER